MRSIARNLCPHSNPVRFPLVHDVVSSKTWTSLGAWVVPMMSSTRILLAAGWPGVGDEDRESLFTEAKTVSNVNGLYFAVVWWREGVKCVDYALWPPSLHVLKIALLKSASAKFTNRRHWVILASEGNWSAASSVHCRHRKIVSGSSQLELIWLSFYWKDVVDIFFCIFPRRDNFLLELAIEAFIPTLVNGRQACYRVPDFLWSFFCIPLVTESHKMTC